MSVDPRTFLRFWWLVLPGLGIAVAAAILVLYRVDFDSGRLVERNQPTYSASLQLLVTSTTNPYLRSVVPPPAPAGTGADSSSVRSGLAVPTPDVDTLVAAANFLPFFIQSDAVKRIREQMFGPVPGIVTAQALFARDTPRGLRPSEIPIIQVSAVARREEGAVAAADTTVKAFLRWLVSSQDAEGVPPQQRVIVRRLSGPEVTVTQESSNGLAGLAFVAVLLGVGLLVVVLDRQRVPSLARAEPVADAPQTVLLPLRPEPAEHVHGQATQQ